MGISHSPSHSEPGASAIATRRRANALLAAILIPVALLTVAGMLLLWPSGDTSGISVANPYATAEGVAFETGTVQRADVGECPSSKPTVDAGGQASTCLIAYTVPDGGGPLVPVEVTPELAKASAVEAGDRIRYLNLEGVIQGGSAPYVFVDFVRTVPIVALTVLYAVVVIAVARWRGFRAMLGLVGALFILAQFILPGLVEGRPPLLLGLVGSVAIMIGVLYFAHGFSARTSTALLGTIFGLAITALLAAWSTGAAHLTGVGDENAYRLVNSSDQLSISSIILCGLIISGLGVLNDVTITQSSAVWELYELAPSTPARRLFTGAMRIGRDHIASTVYTIAFAYAGAALPVLILVSLYDRALVDTLTSGELAEEVVRTLVGSIGLVLAIPVTTLIAVAVVKAVGGSGGAGSGSGPAGPHASATGTAGPAAVQHAVVDHVDHVDHADHVGPEPAGAEPFRGGASVGAPGAAWTPEPGRRARRDAGPR